MSTTTTNVGDDDDNIIDNQTTTTTPVTTTTTTTTTTTVGIAGRTDYSKWDTTTKQLLNEMNEQEENEIEVAKKELGLNGKYARSKAEAEERTKAKEVQQVKRTLDNYQRREEQVIMNLKNIFELHKNNNQNNQNNQHQNQKNIIRLTRHDMDAGTRVIKLQDTIGRDPELDTIVLTQDLSHLESKLPTNVQAKSYPDDVETITTSSTTSTTSSSTKGEEEKEKELQQQQLQQLQQQQQRPSIVKGCIKVFLQNLSNCTILIKCKIISGTIELNHCNNIHLKIYGPDAIVSTIQLDLSSNIIVQLHDVPSGKNTVVNNDNQNNNMLFWGDDKDDRIFHAGVTNLNIQIYKDNMLEYNTIADYIKDGAKGVGNATPEEMQFVTSVHHHNNNNNNNNNNEEEKTEETKTNINNNNNHDDDDDGYPKLVTESVIREGSSTGSQVRAMTERELMAEKKKRQLAAQQAITMAESMIQIKDKDGNAIVTKTKNTKTKTKTKTTTNTATTDSSTTLKDNNNNNNNNNSVTDDDGDDVVVEDVEEEVLSDAIQAILDECNKNKQRGNEAFSAGEYGQAILLYSLALDKAEELPTSLLSASSNTTTTNNNKIIFPRDVILSNRSACFLKLGQYEKALIDTTRAIQYNSNNVKALFRQGLSYHAMSNYQMALPSLVKALQLEPNNKQIKQALQFCEVRLEQEHRRRMAG